MVTTLSGHSSRAFFYVAMVATVAAVGGLLFGYDTGVISGAILFIERDFHLDDVMQGLVVSTVTLGALIGAFVAGVLADSLGRRATNIAAGLLFVLASVLSAAAPGVWVLIASRLLVGVAIGLTSVAAPMYIAEVAPPAVRGQLVSVFQLAITVGILIAYVVDLALEATGAWRWMLGLAIVPGAALSLGMLPLPDSPRWLFKRGREADARTVLSQIRAGADVESEIEEIRVDLERSGRGTWGELLSPTLRPALTVGIGLAVFQQVTGINAVIYYAPQIFQAAGLSSDAVALAATMGIGVINVAATFIAIGLVDRLGRRPLLAVGVLGMALSLAVLGIAFEERAPVSAGAPPDTALGVVTVLCLAVYMVFFAFSLGPIVWLMISEIYPNRNRAQAVALSAAANWGSNFLVSLTFPIMRTNLGTAVTLWVYAVLGFVTLAFVLWRVPETKGKTLEEIEQLWLSRLGRRAA
ncbi:MAG: sugar porter family MFS transporter [Chloroflexi bacterium]|nr:sugar porter family MFS transporter [Chloroflexota bacterium]